ncbi:MAG: cellulase family glycosylhydrolase [Oscillospiraceae bacterium]|nr:cellulase family glycosylhydrolase [Oscillospiraceae bacterium]
MEQKKIKKRVKSRRGISLLLIAAILLSLFAPTMLATTASGSTSVPLYSCGDVDGNGSIAIADVLEILKNLAKMNNSIDGNLSALKAATFQSKGSSPAIADALEILKRLAGMNSYFMTHPANGHCAHCAPDVAQTSPPQITYSANSVDFKDLTAHQIASSMRVGWNLGNTFDAHNGVDLTSSVSTLESRWLSGQVVTRELIQSVKAQGFDTIRIPVTWYQVADVNDNWKIRDDWMQRVKQVVDWAIAEDMYVILNTHHEEFEVGRPERGAFTLFNSVTSTNGSKTVTFEESKVFVRRMWEQIAPVFKDYNEKLILETLNEPRGKGSAAEWQGGTQEERDNLNILNQVAVDTIRASGGNNVHRIIMIPTYAAASHRESLNGFVTPNDPLNTVNKFILSVHIYEPNAVTDQGNANELSDIMIDRIDTALNRVELRANALGLPVVIGEWGTVGRVVMSDRAIQAGLYIGGGQYENRSVIGANARGFVTVWWDNGTQGRTGFALFERHAPHNVATITDVFEKQSSAQPIIDAIMKSVWKGAVHERIKVNFNSGGDVTGGTSTTTTSSSPGISNPTTVSSSAFSSSSISANSSSSTSSFSSISSVPSSSGGSTSSSSSNYSSSFSSGPTVSSESSGVPTSSSDSQSSSSSSSSAISSNSSSSGSGVIRFTITLNANGGSGSPASVQTSSGSAPGVITSDITPPTRPGYVFDGWYTSQTGGEKVSYYTSSGTVFTSDTEIWARWISEGDNSTVTSATTTNNTITGTTTSSTSSSSSTATTPSGVARFTITLNANGGTVSPTSVQTSSGTAPGVITSALPTPTRSGHTFNGWYTSQTGGTLVVAGTSSGTVFTSDTEIWARWSENGSGGNLQSVSASQVVSRMGAGWNLGNTFDAYSSGSSSYSNPINGSGWNWLASGNYANMTVTQMETAWLGGSSHAVTRQLIQNVKASGFNTIRIPVTWHKAISGSHTSSSFTIRAEWMTRVKQVVDWAIAEDMYVILNTHHDEYILPFSNSSETNQSRATLTRLWTLIGNEFNDSYGERLIFEVLNEPRVKGHAREWEGGSRAHRQNLNQLNQAAVDAIRATGGNNRYRILMIPTYAASSAPSWANNEGGAFDSFVKPTDTGNTVNKLILSVHAYDPGGWTGISGTGGSWSTSDITTVFNRIQTASNNFGMPVVLGEWGAVARHESATGSGEGTSGTGRAAYARTYTEEATKRGFVTVWWDTGLGGAVNAVEGRWGLFNRQTGALHYNNITNAIMAGTGSNSSAAAVETTTVTTAARAASIVGVAALEQVTAA